MKNSMVMVGVFLVGIMAFFAIFADVITPYNPSETNILNSLAPPSSKHIMGTDQLGRDVFSRMLYGARISLLVGFVAVGISTALGILFGAVAGFYGGKIESSIMRFVDIMLCFPSFFLILAVIAFLEPSIINIMVVIGLTSWMGAARLVRAEFLKLKNQDFILAAQLQGVSNVRLILKYLLPNAMAPLFVSFTLGVAGAILIESSLSFLGIGVQPPTPSWGNILIDGKATLEVAWWLSVFPGLAILFTVLGYNLLGEGLRDWLDPRQQEQH